MRSLLFFVSLLLGACATPPTLNTVSPVHRGDTAFNLNGRFAVHHQDANYSGGLRWQHQAQRDELLLQGPLGITAARIVSDSQTALLERNGKRYQAADVASLMQQVLGWGLPLAVLHHWLLGDADETLPAVVERDVQGRITLLRQSGWEVRYVRYADDSAASLPSRMILRRENLQVQLLLDEWEWQ